MTDYTDLSAAEFQQSDHRLAGATPVAQPSNDDHDPSTDPHRLAGAEPAHADDSGT